MGGRVSVVRIEGDGDVNGVGDSDFELRERSANDFFKHRQPRWRI